MSQARTSQLLVEHISTFADDDLGALCEAADAAILDGGGFGWVKSPGRTALERYFTGLLMVPGRELFVARMEGTIYGSAQLARPARHNEAQLHAAQLTASFIAPYARSHGLARLLTRLHRGGSAGGMDTAVLNLDRAREHRRPRSSFMRAWATCVGACTPAYSRIAGKTVRGVLYYYKLLTPHQRRPDADAVSGHRPQGWRVRAAPTRRNE